MLFERRGKITLPAGRRHGATASCAENVLVSLTQPLSEVDTHAPFVLTTSNVRSSLTNVVQCGTNHPGAEATVSRDMGTMLLGTR